MKLAGMAELVDARDSKSRDGNIMGVRPPLPAPPFLLKKLCYIVKRIYIN